ncbi:MAG: uncharacterized protein JWO85_1297 [Candidatus Eremiobacteraeota bacterium]|nr:uncharacterized protein [Candidatus Eremiobacteraeota bacterium]
MSAALFGRVFRIVAVVGCQRSGTTLTGQILGASPEAVLIDEEDGLYPWFHAFAEGASDAGRLADEMFARARSKYREPERRFRTVGTRVQPAPGVTCIVLKAPNLTYDEVKISRLGVPVTIVYPVRDPRAVVSSMARLGAIDFVGNQQRLLAERPAVAAAYERELQTVGDEAAPPWVRRAALWRIKTGRATAFRNHGLPMTQFRYEDLVRDPRAAIAPLLAACALGGAPDLEAREAYRGAGPGGTDRTRAIDAASANAWTSALSASEERDVLATAGPLATAFGYV